MSESINYDDLMENIAAYKNKFVGKSLEVSQDQLREILRLEAVRDQLLDDIEALKSNVEFRIREGGFTEPGTLTAFIEKHAGRRSPKWREEFEKIASRERAEEILSNTPVSGGYERLIVKEIGGKKE